MITCWHEERDAFIELAKSADALRGAIAFLCPGALQLRVPEKDTERWATTLENGAVAVVEVGEDWRGHTFLGMKTALADREAGKELYNRLVSCATRLADFDPHVEVQEPVTTSIEEVDYELPF